MGIKETLIRLGDFTADSCVTLKGSTELCAENCRHITACDENMAVLSMKGLDLRVVGAALTLENYGAYGVKLTGEIHSVTIERRDE